MNYKLLLFDADGTLYDFKKVERRAFNSTMLSFSIKGDLDILHTSYKIINRQMWIDFEDGKISSEELRIKRFQLFIESEKLNADPEKMSTLYISELSKGTDLIDGAQAIIEHLSDRSELAIITNGIADVQYPRIRNSNLSQFIQNKIYVSEEIGFPKPDIRYFIHVHNDFKHIPKSDILVIGDNLFSDIKGGNDFGVDTCWFNPNSLPENIDIHPSYEIGDLNEIKQIINNRE